MSDHNYSEWSNFISDPSKDFRYLFATANVVFAEATAPEDEHLKQFFDKLRNKDVSIQYISRLFYLTQPNLVFFFNKGLPNILRGITHASAGKISHSHGCIRGKVLWQDTLLARLSGRLCAGSYIVKQSEKSVDLPENRLLKLFLSSVVESIDKAVKLTGTALLPKIFADMYASSVKALKGPYLDEVENCHKSTSVMLQRCNRHRNKWYGEAALLQTQYESLLLYEKWEAIVELIKVGWLEPVDRDDLFELYVLALVLDIFKHDLGFTSAIEYGLITKGRKYVAKYQNPETKDHVYVYFDQAPQAAFESKSFISKYTKIINSYHGVTGTSRRPDMLVKIVKSCGQTKYVLVEVKKTKDDYYKRDSIYKVLGYLKDFEVLWPTGNEQYAHAVLVFPEGVRLMDGLEDTVSMLALASADERDSLTKIFSKHTTISPYDYSI